MEKMFRRKGGKEGGLARRDFYQLSGGRKVRRMQRARTINLQRKDRRSHDEKEKESSIGGREKTPAASKGGKKNVA